MIVCNDCGANNQAGDDFCGSCGSFLEFSATPASVGVTSTAAGATAVLAPPAAPVPTKEAQQANAQAERDARTAQEARAAAEAAARSQAESEAAARAVGQRQREAAVAAEAERLAQERVEAQARDARAAEELEAARREEEALARRAAEAAEAARRADAEQRRQAELGEARRSAEAERLAAEEASRVAAERARHEADSQARAEAEAAAAAAEVAAREAAGREQAMRAAQEQSAREAQEAAQLTREREQAEDARLAAVAEESARQRRESEAALRAAADAAVARRAAAEQAAAALAQERAEREAAAQLAARTAAEEAERAAAREAEAAKAAEAATRLAALVAKPVTSAPAAQSVTPSAGAGSATGPAGTVPGQREETAARKPSEVRKRVAEAPTTPAPVNIINPGDLVCGNCGTGNAPERNFCRRCGQSLAVAAVAPKPPWYRRVFHRKRKVVAAGERPGFAASSATDPTVAQGSTVTKGATAKRKRPKPKLPKPTRAIALLVVVAAGIAVGVPSLRSHVTNEYTTLKNKITPSYSQVFPDRESASSASPGHPAKAAFDLDKGTYWEEGHAPPSGRGQIITAHLSSPVTIRKIGFDLGISDTQKVFVTAGRPRRLHLVFSSGKTADLTMADSPGFQSFTVNGGKSTSVSFEIRETSSAGADNVKASIREIELFSFKP